jgi:hypothetical protein
MIFACDSRATRGIKGPSGVTAQGGPPYDEADGAAGGAAEPVPGVDGPQSARSPQPTRRGRETQRDGATRDRRSASYSMPRPG